MKGLESDFAAEPAKDFDKDFVKDFVNMLESNDEFRYLAMR
jgi:hypothetical protein